MSESMTITSADVGQLDAAPKSTTYVPLQTYSKADLKPGMVVVFVDGALNDRPSTWVSSPMETNVREFSGKLAKVVIVQNVPGKIVGIAFKEVVKGGHTCDGRVPAGHGAWVLPEHLYSSETLAAHQALHAKADAEQKVIDAMLADFITK